MDNQQLVTKQYGADSLLARVEQALIAANLTQPLINWAELAPLDQFHTRGLTATQEVATALNIDAGTKLLDVGCGLGGPARFLAATYQCQVSGIDLNQSFIDVANMLTQRCGLSDQVNLRCANALALPFADDSFDYVWTQHVAMNIADREKFYREIHRVLKPKCRLAIYDVLADDGSELIFPLPWARKPEFSFLLSLPEMQSILKQVGFTELSLVDKTEAAIKWFAELSTRTQFQSALSLAVVMGAEFSAMAQNLGRNLQAGKVRLVQTIVQS